MYNEIQYDIEKFFDYSLDMLCIARIDGYIFKINPSFQKAFGWATEELLAFNSYSYLHPEDVEPTYKVIDELNQGIPILLFQNRYRCSDGTYKNFSWTAFPDRSAGLIYAIGRDITEIVESNRRLNQLAAELKNANDRLFEQASTDPLTKLKNRRTFNEELQFLIDAARRKKGFLSLIMIDVDHFKEYNDRFGHPAGDRVLVRLACVLTETLRVSDLLARFGGEEFVIALPDMPELKAIEVAERLVTTVRKQFWENTPITISAGISTLDFGKPTDQSPYSDCASAIIEEADQALYRSKANGRDRHTHSSKTF
ncbi:sensor domain-containing diguanylate cyclase [Leptospira yasudae]|uniref:diguanylate cyclase n=1 Tax=Leptospira yasudae TaxID=2202201 RepID=A0A6N4QE25_9LEPT|nr:sensor domain-containing diguanylate cyclase [Leptospira yasudae]TGL76059.1 sensor domain-containing diguanylate cyclase [Leptospira yasudae]TGL83525.1 sensor domain-containing diguanylate cyclase [Leptospira yasudae]TGL85429.1 sensor domain-containing diguanylate cyclase [Leptospira yasudae]